MFRFLPRPTFANGCALAALLLAGSGLAAAAIPGRSGTITACYRSGSGTLRVLDVARRGTAGHCRHGERNLSWSQQGRAGADGRPGRDGVNGANGVNGAASVVYRRIDTSFVTPGTGTATGVNCQPGERVLGGAAGWVRQADDSYDSAGAVSVAAPTDGTGNSGVLPTPDQGSVVGYVFAGKNTAASGNEKLVGYVICARP